MTKPYLSIIIPAYNEARLLPACLESLNQQKAAPAYEVIVVDNGSSDATARLAIAAKATLLSETRRGVCFARQAGFVAARGEIVISTDADCLFPNNWLMNIARDFQKQEDLVLRLGNYRFGDGGRWLNRLLGAWESLSLRFKYGRDWHWYVSAANLSFRRAAFQGYDTSLTQGGDELFVISSLKRVGRILYRFDHPIITSSRRLQKGFLKVLIHDFLIRYILNYTQSRRAPSRMSRSYTPHRELVKKQTDYSALFVLFIAIFTTGFGIFGVFMLLSRNVNAPLIIFGLFSLGLGFTAYGMLAPHAQLLGPQVYRVATTRPVIALTFDDGPNGVYSTAIADCLERYNGYATFFQVGFGIEREPSLTKQLASRGHLIGNHSYQHAGWDYLHPRRFMAGVVRTTQLIKTITGTDVLFFRFPWLYRMPWLLKRVRILGLIPIAGSFASIAEFRQPSAAKIFARAYRKAKPGAILIFHDGYNGKPSDRSQTVAAVELLCARLHQEGYQFVSLDKLI